MVSVLMIEIPVVLASASPRRQELLKELVDTFEIDSADLDEDALTVSDPWETAKGLALAKAKAVSLRHPGKLVIGGDTVVAFESEAGQFTQLAKPTDVADAQSMLGQLAGRSHVVITGLALARDGEGAADAATTQVRFRELSDAEIAKYVATGEPMDKAGAYAIQGGAAGFVVSVEGSISNVIGLALELLREMLDTVH